jgi:hypothetical protein
MSQASFEFRAESGTVRAALEVPVARKADPMPSKLAAEQVTASGRREGQLLAVLALLRRHPRSTSLELSRHGSLDRYIVARRLPELEHVGLVRRLPARICIVGNRQATVWEAI